MMLPDLIRLIENDGWCRVRMRGSHRQYVHPQKPGVLTIRRRRGAGTEGSGLA